MTIYLKIVYYVHYNYCIVCNKYYLNSTYNCNYIHIQSTCIIFVNVNNIFYVCCFHGLKRPQNIQTTIYILIHNKNNFHLIKAHKNNAFLLKFAQIMCIL